MKISTMRRLNSLLLAFVMVLSLTPVTLAAEGKFENMTLTCTSFDRSFTGTAEVQHRLVLDPSTTLEKKGVTVNVALDPTDDEAEIAWASKDPSIVSVEPQKTEHGHRCIIYGEAAGIGYVTATVNAGTENEITRTIEVEVSGIKLSSELASQGLELIENETKQVILDADYTLFGNAKGGTLKATVQNANSNSSINADTVGTTIVVRGVTKGSGVVQLTVTAVDGTIYQDKFTVTVTANEETIEYTGGCSPSNPLKFSVLAPMIAQRFSTTFPGVTMRSVVGLSVPTSQGVIYLGYQSPEDTGAGAGSSVTYYYGGNQGPYLTDLTFVPNASYTGEKAVISFTAQGYEGDTLRTLRGSIEVTLTREELELTVSTNRETPLQLTATLFSKACQEQTSSPLSYVIFTLPSASQGVLYTGYKSEWDYGSKVSATREYKLKELDDITFVPARGFVGTVSVSYAGYNVSGVKYNGQLVIQVRQGLDDVISYNDDGAGAVTFSRVDFDDFYRNATGSAIYNYSISFSQLPSSQGRLYYNWTGIRGTAVTENDVYGPTQIDRLTFVAANGFDGVVRIPFSGTDRLGETFKGTVEIHIKSNLSGNGDINYTCAPGESVKLMVSDFANLCQAVTGEKLYYISFQQLPDFNKGTIYHNRTSSNNMGTRVTTAAKYFNSATPYIANLSFWATDNFRGGVEIPFTGAAVTGETFTGLLYISSGEGAGSGTAGAVRYTVTAGSSVTFSGADFDAACRQATNAALDHIRFDLPSSGQGILYYDYSAKNTPKAHDPSTILYRTGLAAVEKVTFVPATGFAGIAYVPFTAWSINGTEYRGNVEITVRSGAAMGGLVRYETTGAPVHFSAADVLAAAGEQPASLRLTGLPAVRQGMLYYGYKGPTQYSWEGNTTTSYSIYGDPSVSDLTFVPKAGYAGTVEIPYTFTYQDGTSGTGTFRVEVKTASSSANCTDLTGYSAQYISAVDFLYSIGVTNGTGGGKFEPAASIRRGDFCLMLTRAFAFNVGSSSQGFRDVPADAYYAQAVNQMYAIGVVNGVGGGKFDPLSPVSRQDAALMVQRALNQAGISAPDGNDAALASYSDRGQVKSYARGAVGGLAQLGIFPVTGKGTLAPTANLSRADMALLLHRAVTQF